MRFFLLLLLSCSLYGEWRAVEPFEHYSTGANTSKRISSDGLRIIIDNYSTNPYVLEYNQEGQSWEKIGGDLPVYYDGVHPASISGDGNYVVLRHYNNGSNDEKVTIHRLMYEESEAVAEEWVEIHEISISSAGQVNALLNFDGSVLYVSNSRNVSGSITNHNINYYTRLPSSNYYSVLRSTQGNALSDEIFIDINSDGSKYVYGYPQYENAGVKFNGSNVLNILSSNLPDETRGRGVSINSNGDIIAVNENNTIVIWREGFNGDWTKAETITNPSTLDSRFGQRMSLSGNGQLLCVGAYPANGSFSSESSKLFIYSYSNGGWVLDHTEEVGSHFSTNAGLPSGHFNEDGSVLFISANQGSRVLRYTEPQSVPILNINTNYDLLLGSSLFVDAVPVDGFPISFTYQWYFNNFAIPSIYGGTGSSFLIEGVQENEGDWRVKVTNDAGTTTHDLSVNIVEDSDSDGIYNYQETNTGIYVSPSETGSDPNNEDTDGDTILDGTEITNGTNPNLADTDSDGLSDPLEVTYGSDPNLPDTSGDGLSDAVVVNAGFDPTVDYSNLINVSRQGMTDLRNGSTMIEIENGQATLSMELEQSDDLEIWTSGGTTNLQIPIDASSDTKFFRFKMAE